MHVHREQPITRVAYAGSNAPRTLASIGLTTCPNHRAATTDLIEANGAWVGHRIYSGLPTSGQIAAALRRLGSKTTGEKIELLRPTHLPGELHGIWKTTMRIVDTARAQHGLSDKYSYEASIVSDGRGAILGYFAQNSIGDAVVIDPTLTKFEVLRS